MIISLAVSAVMPIIVLTSVVVVGAVFVFVFVVVVVVVVGAVVSIMDCTCHNAKVCNR